MTGGKGNSDFLACSWVHSVLGELRVMGKVRRKKVPSVFGKSLIFAKMNPLR